VGSFLRFAVTTYHRTKHEDIVGIEGEWGGSSLAGSGAEPKPKTNVVHFETHRTGAAEAKCSI